ncbi:hypothetical protein [Bathymodiolus japonicus methanotrophic gill symbiont]|nr:hypothetical protein [Bathymodiolus japonicus methanotrophic gill symbiont]
MGRRGGGVEEVEGSGEWGVRLKRGEIDRDDVKRGEGMGRGRRKVK